MDTQTIQQPDTQSQLELLDQLHHWLCRIKPLVQCEELNFVEQARAGRALREAFEVVGELRSQGVREEGSWGVKPSSTPLLPNSPTLLEACEQANTEARSSES